MATIAEEIVTAAPPELVWDAVRDIGALHTRLVVGFVVDTRLEPGGRVVTFHNGMVVKERIVTVDGPARRLVWSTVTDALQHYNASVQVFDEGRGSRVVWVADFLPDSARDWVHGMIRDGMAAMKATLDAQQTVNETGSPGAR
jgi:polyketide cyclase/dehydrase/lipid transport protein